jgi:hypothetical protein
MNEHRTDRADAGDLRSRGHVVTGAPPGHTVIRVGDRVWLDLWRVGWLPAKVIGVEDHSPTGDPNDARPTPLLELIEARGRFDRGQVLHRGSTVVFPRTGWRGSYPDRRMVHDTGYCHEWEPCLDCARVTSWDDDQVEAFVAGHRRAALDAAHQQRARAGLRNAHVVWSPQAADTLDRAARLFYQQNRADLATWLDPAHAGYDLWMTRAYGDLGYWTRYLPTDNALLFSAYALNNRRRRIQLHVAAFNNAMQRLTVAAFAKPFCRTGITVGEDGTAHLT